VISIGASVTPDNSESRSRLLWKISGNGAAGPSSGNFAGGNPTVTLTPEENSRSYSVQAGTDKNSDGILQEREVLHSITVCLVKAVITCADVTTDQIEIELKPSGLTGTLTLELTGDEAVHRIRSEQRTGNAEPFTETFGIPNLAIGEYGRLRCVWIVGRLSVTAEYDYHIKVLGIYRHSQYNTVDESTCALNTEQAYITTENDNGISQCFVQGQYYDTQLRASFIDQVNLNGSGTSVRFGDIKRDFYCPGTNNAPLNANQRTFRQTMIGPTCGSLALNDNTVARRPDHPDLDCGDRIYIHTIGMKTVTDLCPGCPNSLVPEAVDQLDNYTTDSRCTGVNDLGNFMTIKLYE